MSDFKEVTFQLGDNAYIVFSMTYHYSSYYMQCDACNYYFIGDGNIYDNAPSDKMQFDDGTKVLDPLVFDRCLGWALRYTSDAFTYPFTNIKSWFKPVFYAGHYPNYTNNTNIVAIFPKLTTLDGNFYFYGSIYEFWNVIDVYGVGSFVYNGNYSILGQVKFSSDFITFHERALKQCGVIYSNSSIYIDSNIDAIEGYALQANRLYIHGLKNCNTLGDWAVYGSIINLIGDKQELEIGTYEIGNKAFYQCSLPSTINLAGVKIIHQGAFCVDNCITTIKNFYVEQTLNGNNENVNNDNDDAFCFWCYDGYSAIPVDTKISGDYNLITRYNWGIDNRRLNIITGYTLNIENHNDKWITIPLSSDETGQLKFSCDDNILTCHLTDDLDTKYTGVFVCADEKWYQFKE